MYLSNEGKHCGEVVGVVNVRLARVVFYCRELFGRRVYGESTSRMGSCRA